MHLVSPVSLPLLQEDEGDDDGDGGDDEDNLHHGAEAGAEDDPHADRYMNLTKSCGAVRKSLARKILPMHPDGTFCTSADGPLKWCNHPEDFLVRYLWQLYESERVGEMKPWMPMEKMRALLWRCAD